MSEIKPVFYVDATTLRCRTMDDISDESVLYYRRGDKVCDTDVALYPESAIEELQKENAELKAEVKEWLCLDCNTVFPSESIPNSFSCLICPKCDGKRMPKNTAIIKVLQAESAAQAKRIAELEAATEHLGLTPKQAADGLARHKAQVAEIESLRKHVGELLKSLETDSLDSCAAIFSIETQNLISALSASKNGE